MNGLQHFLFKPITTDHWPKFDDILPYDSQLEKHKTISKTYHDVQSIQ